MTETTARPTLVLPEHVRRRRKGAEVFKGFKIDKNRQTGVEALQVIYSNGEHLEYSALTLKRGMPMADVLVMLAKFGDAMAGTLPETRKELQRRAEEVARRVEAARTDDGAGE